MHPYILKATCAIIYLAPAIGANYNRVEEKMNVIGAADPVRFENMPAGAPFLAKDNGHNLLICAKLLLPKEAANESDMCVVFFPHPSDYPGPGVAHFSAWFPVDVVVPVPDAAIVLDPSGQSFVFQDGPSLGDVILHKDHRYLAVKGDKAIQFVDLANGNLSVSLPSTSTGLRCRRWSIERTIVGGLEMFGRWDGGTA